MRLSSVIAVLILFFKSAGAQSVPLFEIKGEFKFFTTDQMGNLYVLTPENDIRKYDPNGKKIAEANFKVLGDASLIDATNPMEIYVWFRDQNKLLYFDNLLNYRGETDLYKLLNTNNIQVVCRSYDNGIWFFDPDGFKLKKINKQGTLLTESVNLSFMVDTVLVPELLLDDGKYVYLKSGANRLIQFDVLGNFIQTVVLEPFIAFQLQGDEIVYAVSGRLYSYHPKTFAKYERWNAKEGTPETSVLNIRMEERRIYVQQPEGIFVYRN